LPLSGSTKFSSTVAAFIDARDRREIRSGSGGNERRRPRRFDQEGAAMNGCRVQFAHRRHLNLVVFVLACSGAACGSDPKGAPGDGSSDTGGAPQGAGGAGAAGASGNAGAGAFGGGGRGGGSGSSGVAGSIGGAGIGGRGGTAVPDGGPDSSVPPMIVTTTLAAARVGLGYRQQLAVVGGRPPITWAIVARSTALDWLRIDEETGLLSGTPSLPSDPQSVRVGLQDADLQTDSHTFTLAVSECSAGETAACYLASDTACLVGLLVCSNGRFQPCSGGSPSTDVGHCSSGCGSCGTAGDRCTDGRCRCGAANACSAEKATCCGPGGQSECVNVKTDIRYCGSCANPCDTDGPNVAARCVDGACDYPCAPGWGRCPAGINTTGCDTSLLTDATNCGGCGNICPNVAPNAIGAASPPCQAGRCQLECRSGWFNCNGDNGDGCEVDVTTIQNCGACGKACPLATNGSARCNAGNCEMTCSGQLILSGSICTCPMPPHVTTVSRSGDQCAISVCATGWRDCNGKYDDGCETETLSNRSNCGSCGRSCPSDRYCSGGDCYQPCGPPYDCPSSQSCSCDQEGHCWCG